MVRGSSVHVAMTGVCQLRAHAEERNKNTAAPNIHVHLLFMNPTVSQIPAAAKFRLLCPGFCSTLPPSMNPSFKTYSEWLATRRSKLSRGGLWLEGREPGRPDPAGFDTAKLKILICRLSPYEDVLASITHRILLHAAQSVPGVFADLAFFPSESDALVMRQDDVPFWLATGCKRPPADFDVVAISLSVQQEAIHLPLALKQSGLQLDFEGRMAAERHPFLLLGGHGAASVPFLHGDANGPGTGGLVDAVCLGDGITWLREFLQNWMQALPSGMSKRDFLCAQAKSMPGTYVPSLYRHNNQAGRLASIVPLHPDLPMPAQFRQDSMADWLKDYDGAFIPFSDEELEETLPLAAGCLYRCRFCQTGWMRKEFSAASRDGLLDSARKLKTAMVNSDLNLLASDACSLSGLEEIMDDLCPLFRHVSMKSLSVSSLVRRPEYFDLLRKLAKHEFTFGVEGISARLRAYLGKPATAHDLIRIAASLSHSGLRQLKLFFILTGLEEERDVQELERLIQNIHLKVPACRIIASFMPLFHAPFTPLQFATIRALNTETERSLSLAVRHAGAEFRWSALPDEIALMNRLCRAGRMATPALVHFSIQKNLRYDRGLPPALIRELASSVPADTGEQNGTTVFPWSDIQASATSKILWKSYQKACQELQNPPEAVAAMRPLPAPAPSRKICPPPSPPEEAKRFHFWAVLQPGQARFPDHVIARSLFRMAFSKTPESAFDYLGHPVLLRPPGTSGFALLSAEFRKEPRLPLLEKANDLPAESTLFALQWPHNEMAKALRKCLHQARVKFQTVRQGDALWHVVEKPFRARTGIAAVKELPQHTLLFCHPRPDLLEGKEILLSGPAGNACAVLSKSETPCPACKGAALRILQSDRTEQIPTCFDCLIRPGTHAPG